MSDFLSTEDVATLNAARKVLATAGDRLSSAVLAGSAPNNYATGRALEALERGKDGIFRALLISQVYGEATISEAELHGGIRAVS